MSRPSEARAAAEPGAASAASAASATSTAGTANAPVAPGLWARALGALASPHGLLLQEGGVWDAGNGRMPNATSQRYADFESWCRSHPHHRCDLWLSGSLVHELVCDPALPLAGDAALIDYARPVFVHYHGEGAHGWPLAAWSSQGQQGVSALHGVDLPRLARAAREHAVRLRSLRPWWVRVLALALRRVPELRWTPQAWLLLVEGRFVNALRLHRGALAEVRSQWLGEASPRALQALAAPLRGMPPAADFAAPVFAIGQGLQAGPVPGVQAIDPLDGAAPPSHWLLPPRTQA